MEPDAYCIHSEFPVTGPAPFRMDRHYFLCAVQGTMRLEAGGQRWTLPPARAALIEAGYPVTISILSELCAASVLFEPSMLTPPQPLTVFDVSPLARALVAECRDWGPEAQVQTPYAREMFRTLALVVRRLAETPSRCVLPAPESAALSRALALTEEAAPDQPRFEDIARASGQSARTLARRFSEEMGMTWREALRRIRIIRAVEILAAEDDPITDVALQVGYTSISAFNAAFRDLMGQTPSEYRTMFRT
jgi:AraC-like DNA-binding protein